MRASVIFLSVILAGCARHVQLPEYMREQTGAYRCPSDMVKVCERPGAEAACRCKPGSSVLDALR